MLVTTEKMLRKAYEEHYAVPAINTQGGTYDIICSICKAAEEAKSPIILAHYLNTGEYSGNDWFMETAKWMADKVNVPVAIHLDHGNTFEQCMEMLKLGCTSIMYDGSTLSTEKNAEKTNEIIRICHSFGVPVEAEIGELARNDEEGRLSGNSNAASPDQVRKYLNLCHPDSLAISIGNAHGFYKEPVNIKLDILAECRSFTDIPFVLHGCTGMKDEQVRKSIEYGVAKINFGTQIRTQYIAHLKEGLDMGVDNGHAWRLSEFAEKKLRADIRKIIKLAGSENRVS